MIQFLQIKQKNYHKTKIITKIMVIILQKSTNNTYREDIIMKSDIIFGMLLGSLVGAMIATYNKPTQQAIKKGTEIVKNETSKVLEKAKEKLDE